MRRTLLLALFVLVCMSAARAQQTLFVPVCTGVNDTARFTFFITRIGSNTGTIRLPYKNGTRCAVNTLTIPENVTLDNSDGTGIKVNSGQTLTVLGPVVNPVLKSMFFGPGTTVFAGNSHIGANSQVRTSDGQGGESWTTVTGGGGGGAVNTVFNRSGDVVAVTNDYSWNQINKATSRLDDITLRSADLLSNGTTGTGQIVLRDSPVLITPTLGAANATSINGLTIASTTGASISIANAKAFTVSNTLTLAGVDGSTLTVPATGTAVLESRTITEGAGLAGNTYDLSANRTLQLGPPSTLSVSSLTSVSGTTHSHAITTSANPGAAAAVLATDASGFLRLTRLGIAIAPTQPLEVNGNVFISAATANLFLKDTNTGFQATSPLVVTLQADNCLRSTNFTSGLVGLNVCSSGNAEFNNVDVRGAIHASIFTFNAINATAGTLGVFKSAAKLRSDVAIPGSPTYGITSVTIDVVDAEGLAHGASQLFVVNDILRLKDGLVGDTWFRVSAASNQSTFWRYTAVIMAGSNNVTYRAGMGVPDYGQTGQGFIIQTADQTNSPYLQMATHTAAFSSQDVNGTLTVTPRLRLGNLNGSYGYASDVYGFGTGQFGTAGQSWLTVDPINGVRIGNNTTVLTQVDAAGNATFTGTVTANAGSFGGWTINSSSLARDTGTNSTSAGLSPTDFPFFAGATVANRATAPFRVTTAGALTASNATITGAITATSGSFTGSITASSGTVAGWTINSNSFTRNEVKIAAGVDISNIAGVGEAWFGKSAFGNYGLFLKGTSSSYLSLSAGHPGVGTSGRPYIEMWDGTRRRIVIGELNTTIWDGVATNSIGMKIWSSAGTKLVEFSDVENIIGGWVITGTSFTSGSGSTTVGLDTTSTGGDDVRIYAGNSAPVSAPFRVTEAGALTATVGSLGGWTIGTTKISSTGIDIRSGASAALAFGATPPTSTTTGSGILLNSTGLFALSSDTQKAIFSSSGIQTIGTGSFQAKNAAGVPLTLETQNASGGFVTSLVVVNTFGTGNDGRLRLQASGTTVSHTAMQIRGNDLGSADFRFFNDSADILGITIGADSAPALTGTGAGLQVTGNTIRIENSRTPASASATCNKGEIAWDASFTYVCVATNTWKRSALSTW